jgi:hypothetical protein
MELKLNIKLIELEMERRGITHKDLCKKWRLSRTAMYYVWKERPVSYATKFAKILNINPKDLLV